MYLAGEKRTTITYFVLAIVMPIVVPWIDFLRRVLVTMNDPKSKAKTFQAAVKYLCNKKSDFANLMKGVYPGMGFFFWVLLAACVVLLLLSIAGFVSVAAEKKRIAAAASSAS
ncbi:MAG: hypothetical protein MJZ11_01830 [Lachnospiraceae bacterium]|nr:hypothetical protein [Lachnospiraceae bacterium]